MKPAKYLFALLSAVLITACGGSDDPVVSEGSTTTASASTIDKVAQEGGFNALLAAATKAELGSTLGDPNAQFTVFAPTDAAFNKLAESLGFKDASALVEALPADTLKDILSYHVLQGTKPASELASSPRSTQETLYRIDDQAATLALDTQAGVKITDAALTSANVTAADVTARNGVVHAIDKVLVPPGVLNIVQMAQVNPQLSTLVQAVSQANLADTLSGAGPFTVFAPVNAAFEAAPSGLSTEQLVTVLTYHALDSQVLASQIPFGTPVSTLAGQPITINAGTPPTISDTTASRAAITATDVRASNGVIHLIDKVLIPAL